MLAPMIVNIEMFATITIITETNTKLLAWTVVGKREANNETVRSIGISM